jgi:hypothetical protein
MLRHSLTEATRTRLRPVYPLLPVGLRFPALEFTTLKIALRAALRSCSRGILSSASVRTNPDARSDRRCGQRGACSLLSCSLQEKTACSTPTAPPRLRLTSAPRRRAPLPFTIRTASLLALRRSVNQTTGSEQAKNRLWFECIGGIKLYSSTVITMTSPTNTRISILN